VFLALALILFLALPDPWNLVFGGVSVVLGVGEVIYWQRRLRGQRVSVGVQTLVGATGEVTTPCRPLGQVRVGGEIWAARCAEGADPGDRVRVVEVDRLTLVVEPDRSAAR
jgi:membrane protein implicated in regulation of membrane protease activity